MTRRNIANAIVGGVTIFALLLSWVAFLAVIAVETHWTVALAVFVGWHVLMWASDHADW